jgi:hypothetical protein
MKNFEIGTAKENIKKGEVIFKIDFSTGKITFSKKIDPLLGVSNKIKKFFTF